MPLAFLSLTMISDDIKIALCAEYMMLLHSTTRIRNKAAKNQRDFEATAENSADAMLVVTGSDGKIVWL